MFRVLLGLVATAVTVAILAQVLSAFPANTRTGICARVHFSRVPKESKDTKVPPRSPRYFQGHQGISEGPLTRDHREATVIIEVPQ